MVDIGARIRELRELKGWTQGKLSRLTSLTRAYISKLESGVFFPGFDKLECFAETFGISVHALLIQELSLELLLDDPFIGEAMPYLLNLTFAQRDQLRDVLRSLAGKKAA